MVWTSTPTPVINATWYKWSGTYTPALSDVGGQFVFTAIFDLDARHSIALDGMVVPEPATLLTVIYATIGLLITRKRR
jgi:hypothetical protein